jgi:hypothetical protein
MLQIYDYEQKEKAPDFAMTVAFKRQYDQIASKKTAYSVTNMQYKQIY